jgi:hypothetical protein
MTRYYVKKNVRIYCSLLPVPTLYHFFGTRKGASDAGSRLSRWGERGSGVHTRKGPPFEAALPSVVVVV